MFRYKRNQPPQPPSPAPQPPSPSQPQTHILIDTLSSSQNQNRLPYQTKNAQERIIIPRNNRIDLNNDINCNTTNKKTIIHVFDKSNGFGDFLRGSIILAQYAKFFNINIKIDVSRHNISKCLNIEPELLTSNDKTHLVCFNSDSNTDKYLYSLIQQFINSAKETLYITTNLYYNMHLVTNDIKEYINSYFTFKQEYYDTVKELFKLNKYNVLHIRCVDAAFITDFEDKNLLSEIIKLQLDDNTFVMSNNYSLKRQINKLFGFHFIDKQSFHTATSQEYTDLESMVIEYIILSKSSHIYSFSYYHHGSGFSEQCSVLYDIPYRIIFLPHKNKYEELATNLLHVHYNNLLGNTFIATKSIEKKNDNMDHIAFITLSNSGYIDYTLNCLQSLKNINMKKTLKVYCIGKEGNSILKNNNIASELIDDEDASDFQKFREKKWSNVVQHKFEIIYNNLLNNEYVCITDGDIVYENNKMFDYLLNNIENNDLLIQSEGIYNSDLCSGFMFIKSNQSTIAFFNPENTKMYKNSVGWDDQVYINANRHKLKFKKLPLHLFPSGKYYYEYNKNINEQNYLIHFNWIIGDEKQKKMIEFNKWYISPKVKICHYGTDGFGHQLEGMLRLLSLSINNKAAYQYNSRKEYRFEHTNFKIDNLTQYLTEALKIISGKETDDKEDKETLNIVSKEQRLFEQILKTDKNIENTIYCYDGVCSNIPNKLPANFEYINELEKSLPILRKAFVEKNIHLPKKSYDDKLINVCCHIRLGDAVGQRVLDTDNLFNVIKEFQKYSKYRIIIHTDGDVTHLQHNNTIINDSKTDVLQVLSDFIYADILCMNYSSLSVAAHLLADTKQNVICPTNAGPTFKYRILNKCITTTQIMNTIVSKYKR